MVFTDEVGTFWAMHRELEAVLAGHIEFEVKVKPGDTEIHEHNSGGNGKS